MARALAGLFGAGGTLALASLLFPHWAGLNSAGLAAPAVLAEVTCALLLTVGPHLPAKAFHAVLTLGTACICVAVYFGGGSTHSTYAAFYVWVALYAFYFFSTRAAFMHLGLAGAGYAAVLVATPTVAAGPAWLIVIGTACVTGVVISSLTRKIHRVARIDALTELPNRRAWDELLPGEVARAHRHEMPLSLAIIDLDGLKGVNDAKGHPAGDQLLRHVARALAHTLRRGDVLARLGGDEFGLVLPKCPVGDAIALISRMQRAVTHQSFCAGVAVLEPGEADACLVARADTALYRAKAAGRNAIMAAEPQRGTWPLHQRTPPTTEGDVASYEAGTAWSPR